MRTLMQINFQNGQPNRQFLVQSFKEIVVSGKNVHQSVSQSVSQTIQKILNMWLERYCYKVLIN